MLQLINANKAIKGERFGIFERWVYCYENGKLSLSKKIIRKLAPVIDVFRIDNSTISVSLDNSGTHLSVINGFDNNIIRQSATTATINFDSSEERIRQLEEEVRRLRGIIETETVGSGLHDQPYQNI